MNVENMNLPRCPSRAGIDNGSQQQQCIKNKTASPGTYPPCGPGKPCECKRKITMCCRKMRYVQPDVPVSYKPCATYKKPESGLESDTVYKRSYMGHSKLDRVNPIIQKDNLHSSGEMSDATTHKMSYRGWPCADPAQPIMPLGHDLFEDGPLQSQTTNRHDFTPKPYSKARPILPCQSIKPSDKPMEDTSTMLESYQAIDPSQLHPAVSFKPESMYKKPSMPFQGNTIHKMSYRPWPIEDKEDFPWAAKAKYVTPQFAMDGDTVYNTSFGAPGTYTAAEKDEDGCYYCNPIECGSDNLPAGCIDQGSVPANKMCTSQREGDGRGKSAASDAGCYCTYEGECYDQPTSGQGGNNASAQLQQDDSCLPIQCQ